MPLYPPFLQGVLQQQEKKEEKKKKSMKNTLLCLLLLGLLASSNGFIFPLLFPVSIKLTIHHHKPVIEPEPVYHFQTVPVYKEVIKKDPSHDKEKHSYGDGYKGSSYGDGYSKTYSDEHHVKGHSYGSTYGTEASKESDYHSPVAYKNNGYVSIGTTFGSGTEKGSGYGGGGSTVSIKAKGFGGDLTIVKSPGYKHGYNGDPGIVKGTSYGSTYGGDSGNVKGTEYGTSYNSDLGSVKATGYGDAPLIKGTAYETTYGHSSKGAVAIPYNEDGTKNPGYSTSYVEDSSHKGGSYAAAYDEPTSGKSVIYSYSGQPGTKGSYGNAPSVKTVAYSNDYSKAKGYGSTYEQPAEGYTNHGYSSAYNEDGTYVVHHPHSSYEERKDDLQFLAGFGTTIYGDSYAKIVYVPKTHVKVSVTAY